MRACSNSSSVEDPIGQALAQRLEPALRRVQFRAVARQRQAVHVVGPADRATAVAAGAVQHQADPPGRHRPPDGMQERLEAGPVHARQKQRHARAAVRLDGDIEPQPFIPIRVQPKRPRAERAQAPAVPDLEPEARLIQGEQAVDAARRELRPEPIFSTPPGRRHRPGDGGRGRS